MRLAGEDSAIYLHPPPNPHLLKWMLFVDGENFTLRAQEFAKQDGFTLPPAPTTSQTCSCGCSASKPRSTSRRLHRRPCSRIRCARTTTRPPRATRSASRDCVGPEHRPRLFHTALDPKQISAPTCMGETGVGDYAGRSGLLRGRRGGGVRTCSVAAARTAKGEAPEGQRPAAVLDAVDDVRRLLLRNRAGAHRAAEARLYRITHRIAQILLGLALRGEDVAQLLAALQVAADLIGCLAGHALHGLLDLRLAALQRGHGAPGPGALEAADADRKLAVGDRLLRLVAFGLRELAALHGLVDLLVRRRLQRRVEGGAVDVQVRG